MTGVLEDFSSCELDEENSELLIKNPKRVLISSHCGLIFKKNQTVGTHLTKKCLTQQWAKTTQQFLLQTYPCGVKSQNKYVICLNLKYNNLFLQSSHFYMMTYSTIYWLTWAIHHLKKTKYEQKYLYFCCEQTNPFVRRVEVH